MSEEPVQSAGAVWRCADLHLHTPGVHSFRLPGSVDIRQEQNRAVLADRYVEKLVAAGIDIAAFTDYQGIRMDFYPLLRQRAEAAGITVLPGAEMSVGQGAGKGVHILLICGPDEDPERLAEVIRHQGNDPTPLFEGRAEHRDLNLRGTLAEALHDIRRHLDCVVIGAHAKDENGILKVLGSPHTAELIRDGLVDALDGCEDAAGTLAGTRVLTTERLESLACTLSSDPHSLDEIGTKTTSDGRRRATWLRLSTVDAGSLRLALHDPATRVLTDPPEPARHPRLLSLSVEGGGHLSDLDLRFNDDLTTLIGGRGAGKSAVLEVLRYTLDAEIYSDQSRRASLISHALDSGGRARVVIERPGPVQQQCYEITRVLDQAPQVTDLVSGKTLDVVPMTLFGNGHSPVFLLQGEIQAVARDGAFRRRLLDEIIGEEARAADGFVRRIVEELRRSSRAMDEIEHRLMERDAHVERLHQLDAEIAFFEQQDVTQKLDRHAAAGADRERLTTAATHTSEATAALDGTTYAVRNELEAATAELNAASSEHADVLRTLAAEVRSVIEGIVGLLDEATSQVRVLNRDIEAATTRWPARVAGLEEDLRRIQAELGADRLDIQRYLRSVGQRTALRPIVAGLDRQDEDLAGLVRARNGWLRQLQDKRREGFRLRQRAAATVGDRLSGTLTVQVGYLGDTAEFNSVLAGLLRGSRVSSDALDAVVRTPGTDGIELAKVVRRGTADTANHFGITAASAQQLVQWLTEEPQRLRDVEALAPQDRVSIALVVDGRPRDLDQLSGGQRATALLLLVFADGDRPLILDQPEDDLDNRFVYEDVVAALRRAKGLEDAARRRQIIAATHNPNIPVNGDAELVLSLAEESGRCVVRTRASVDDAVVRREIRTVLEGGAAAFRRRAEKYGGLDDAG